MWVEPNFSGSMGIQWVQISGGGKGGGGRRQAGSTSARRDKR